MNTRIFESRKFLTFVLLVAFGWSLLNVNWGEDLIHTGGLKALGDFGGALFKLDLSSSTIGNALRDSWTTVAYATAGLSVALVIGIPLGVIGSGTLVRSPWLRRFNIGGARVISASFRSIHELVWAWLFVAAIGLSPLAAVFALAIPYGGILGRIYAELLQDVPDPPLRSLRSSGASEWRVLWYGRIPMALPDMLSYTFYRLECGIRSATVMSFVGLGGLGYRIRLSLDDLAYQQVWTYLLFLIGLVVAVDMWSGLVRRRLAT